MEVRDAIAMGLTPCRSSSCWWAPRSCRTGASSCAVPAATRVPPAGTGRSAHALHQDRGRHPRGLRRGGRRPGVAVPGGQVAEAPHAGPGQLHPVPRVRRRLPVELHLHDVDGHRARARPRTPSRTRSTTPPRSSWSTTTRAPAAPSASTAAPPTPCTMRDCRRVPGGKRTMAEVPASQAASE